MIKIKCDIKGCDNEEDFHAIASLFHQPDVVTWQINTSQWGDVCPECFLKYQQMLQVSQEEIIKKISDELLAEKVDNLKPTVVSLIDHSKEDN